VPAEADRGVEVEELLGRTVFAPGGGCLAVAGVAVAALVHGDQPVRPAERLDLRGEHVGIHQIAVQQQHHWPGAAVST
jgi:hypothetical protein